MQQRLSLLQLQPPHRPQRPPRSLLQLHQQLHLQPLKRRLLLLQQLPQPRRPPLLHLQLPQQQKRLLLPLQQLLQQQQQRPPLRLQMLQQQQKRLTLLLRLPQLLLRVPLVSRSVVLDLAAVDWLATHLARMGVLETSCAKLVNQVAPEEQQLPPPLPQQLPLPLPLLPHLPPQ